MPAPADPIRKLADTLVRQAKADPRKATILAVLVTVMGLMWYRVMSGSGPASAAAYQVGNFGASTAYGAPTGGPPPSAAPPRPARSAAAAAALQEWALRRPIAPLSRNLFVVNYDLFPTDGAR